ncbi:MAG: NAD+ synthase, partial [Burkholderiales bacterium]|nr:NAD+ synthase [Burkholderiales bacterium]
MSVRVAIAQMNSSVGDLAGNAKQIVDYVAKATVMAADIVVTPELSLVGYSPEDLLLRPAFYA